MVSETLRNYLENLETGDLEALLADILQEKNYVGQEHIVLEILRILRHRDAVKDIPNNRESPP